MTFFSILHFIWFLPIFQFWVNALPNRMMTSPYKQKIHNLSLFCQPFIQYGFCLYFNVWAVPSLYDFDMSLWNQKTVNLDPSFDLHGNFCPQRKNVHCLYKTHFVKVSGSFYNVGFLGSGQNRRRHKMKVEYWIESLVSDGNSWK